MKTKTLLIFLLPLVFLVIIIASQSFDYVEKIPDKNSPADSTGKMNLKETENKEGINMEDKIIKSEEEWKKELTPEQYSVLREKGTERAFTGNMIIS